MLVTIIGCDVASGPDTYVVVVYCGQCLRPFVNKVCDHKDGCTNLVEWEELSEQNEEAER